MPLFKAESAVKAAYLKLWNELGPNADPGEFEFLVHDTLVEGLLSDPLIGRPLAQERLEEMVAEFIERHAPDA